MERPTAAASPASPFCRRDQPLPDYSLHFRWEGRLFSGPGTLRVKMAPRNLLVDREGKFPKEFLEKDGWYVTADLSTDPPQVVLTEKPTKGSHWALVKTPQEYGGRKFIENLDARGQAVWLTVGEVEKTYRGGTARKPILAEKSDYFFIEDANSGK